MNLLSSILSPDISYVNWILVIGIWLVALWLMFCLWVFVDAQRRYRKLYIAVLFALVVFVFNFPALIFYMIIRPEESWQDLGLYEIDKQHGGVNVPVINFVGEDGKVEVALNLTVSPRLSDSSDMTVEVGWDSSKPNMKVMETMSMPKIEMPGEEMPKSQGLFSRRLHSLRSKASSSISSMRTTMDNSVKKASADMNDTESLGDKQKAKKKK